MDEYSNKHYELLSETLIKNLKSRNINGYFFSNRNKATEKIFSMINPGDSVSCGGSLTLEQLEIHEKLRSMDINFLDRLKPGISKDEKNKVQKLSLTSDIFLSGINAITTDGKIYFIDCYGNRVAPVLFGPEKVILITGVNKICPDEDYAVKRMKFYTSPANAVRVKRNTPCTKNGVHVDCKIDERICCYNVTIDYSAVKNRINVIIINDQLGF